jgi:hypothetical protein
MYDVYVPTYVYITIYICIHRGALIYRLSKIAKFVHFVNNANNMNSKYLRNSTP